MAAMRAILAGLVLAAAQPVGAQAFNPFGQLELDNLRAQQQAAERRAIDQANQLMALEARLKAEQAVLELRDQRNPPALPPRLYAPAGQAPSSGVAGYPSMPDAALADSNRRVREAAANRR